MDAAVQLFNSQWDDVTTTFVARSYQALSTPALPSYAPYVVCRFILRPSRRSRRRDEAVIHRLSGRSTLCPMLYAVRLYSALLSFSHILETLFEFYSSRFEKLPADTETAFEKIENLIDFYFHIVDEIPDEIRIITSVCPAKLQDAGHKCGKLLEAQHRRLTRYVSDAIEKGIASGEFFPVPVEATVGVIIVFLNGLLRRRILKLDRIGGLRQEAIDFCRRSLVKILPVL